MSQAQLELYFDEPRLKMSAFGRLIIRLVFIISYMVLGVFACLLLLSGIESHYFYLGLFVALFLIDRAIRIGKGEAELTYLPKAGKANLADYLSPPAFHLLEASLDKAGLIRGDFRLVLIAKLLDRQEIKMILDRLEIKKENFIFNTERELGKLQFYEKEEAMTFIAKLVYRAFESSYQNNERFIEPKDLFVALANIADLHLDNLFTFFSINKLDLGTAAIFSHSARGGLWGIFSGAREASGRYPYRLRHRTMNRAWTAKPTPFLDAFGEDLTDLARIGDGGFLVGHEREYDRLSDVLSRPMKPLALLIGEPGVGKTSIVRHLAYRIIKDDVPQVLFDKRLVLLNISRLTSGAPVDELQERVTRVINEIFSAGNVILYIPDLDNLVRTTSSSGMSIGSVLIPAIRGGTLPVIGGVYPREFKKYIEPLSDFASAFEVIRVPEISEADAIKILTYQALGYEREYKVTITFGAVRRAVELAHKYFRARPLPTSAEDLLKEGLSEAVRLQERVLNADTLVSIAERRVNIPIHDVSKNEATKLLNLEAIIHEKLIDQEEAVLAVSRALREYRSGLSRRGGPIASFLFVGPTGVGKTELSKILARIQFGSAELLTRFDMTEYQDKQSIFRFIGSPDGVVNGALTDAILEKPYSIILLDEFEKAHPDILNLFLQVLDDGRLTDNIGRVADFQNAIVIATSNAHSEFILKSLGEGRAVKEIVSEVKKHLSDYFKPELINRFSDIVVFKPLSPTDIKQVAVLQMKIFADEIFETQNITLNISAEALKKIGELGYSQTFGARPLRGVIADKIRAPLSEAILRGDIIKSDTVLVALRGDTLNFEKPNAPSLTQ